MRRFALPLLTAILLISHHSTSRPLFAQTDSSGLSINPAITEKVVAAGQLSVAPVSITNIATKHSLVRVEFRSLAPIDEVIDDTARQRYDATSWLETLTPEFILAPGETQIIDIRINPPHDAGAGGHYANVVFRVLSTSQSAHSQTTAHVSPELKAVFFLTVPGDIQELAVADFRSPNWHGWGGSPAFSADISNIGTIHLLPTVRVTLKTLAGQDIAQLNLPPKLLIPGTRSSLSANWSTPIPGVYRADYMVSYGSPIQQIAHRSGLFIIWPAAWIQVVGGLIGLTAARLVLPPIMRRLTRRRIRFAKDLTGEPQLQINRENLERLSSSKQVKDTSRRR